MKRILALLLATALVGGCAIVPVGHGYGYRGDNDWRGSRDQSDRYDRYDRRDGGSYRDGHGWRDGDDRGR